MRGWGDEPGFARGLSNSWWYTKPSEGYPTPSEDVSSTRRDECSKDVSLCGNVAVSASYWRMDDVRPRCSMGATTAPQSIQYHRYILHGIGIGPEYYQ